VPQCGAKRCAYGLIAIGVSNSGELLGCLSAGVETTNKIERVGEVFCPTADYKTKHVEFEHPDGQRDYVILFRVKYNQSRVVRLTDGRVFIRLGESKKELSADEIRELAAGKGQVTFEQE
jgi:predicted HTH transcriptional regulator